VILSYSSAHCYQVCPYSWWLQYVVRFPVKVFDITGVIPGRVIHQLADMFFKAGGVDWSIFQTQLQPCFKRHINNSCIFWGPHAWAKDKSDAWVKIQAFRDNFVNGIKKKYFSWEWCLSEGCLGVYKKPFLLFPEVDLSIIGAFDLLCGSSKSELLSLIDYKASDSTYYLDKRQLFLYTLAAMKKYEVTISKVAFFLFKPKGAKFVPYPVNKKELEDTKRWYLNIAEGIGKERFSPTPSQYACRLCKFKTACRYRFIPEVKVETVISLLPQASLGG